VLSGTQREPTRSLPGEVGGGEEHGVEVVDVPVGVGRISTASSRLGVEPLKGAGSLVNTEVGDGANGTRTIATLADAANSVSANPGVWVAVPGWGCSKARGVRGFTVVSDESPEGVITVVGGQSESGVSLAFSRGHLSLEPSASASLSGGPAIVDVEVVVHQRVLLEAPLVRVSSQTVGLRGAELDGVVRASSSGGFEPEARVLSCGLVLPEHIRSVDTSKEGIGGVLGNSAEWHGGSEGDQLTETLSFGGNLAELLVDVGKEEGGESLVLEFWRKPHQVDTGIKQSLRSRFRISIVDGATRSNDSRIGGSDEESE